MQDRKIASFRAKTVAQLTHNIYNMYIYVKYSKVLVVYSVPCMRPDQPVAVRRAVTKAWSVTAFPPANTADTTEHNTNQYLEIMLVFWTTQQHVAVQKVLSLSLICI